MVDCLVLNYNDFQTTIKCIQNLIKISLVDHVLIVDNCSTDDSYKKLCEIKEKKLTVVKTDKNGGYGYGNNYGIRLLSSKYNSRYILLCNPDTTIGESAIKGMVDFMINNSDVAIVAPVMCDPNGKIQYNTAFKIPNTVNYILSLEILYSKIFKPIFYRGLQTTGAMEVGGVSGSLFMFDVDTMIKYGMYDEKLFLYNEEMVLAKKMKNAGYKTFLLTDFYFLHEHSASISKTYKAITKRQQLLNESHGYVLRKYFSRNILSLVLDYLIGKINIAENYLIYKYKNSRL